MKLIVLTSLQGERQIFVIAWGPLWNIKDSLGVKDIQSGILHSNRKEQITETWSNVDESQK